MLAITVWIVAGMIGLSMLLHGWRLVVGPNAPDRILAVDALYINSIVLIVLLGIHFATQIYFEAALLIALLGFISTSAFCKYLLRGDIIE